MASAVDPVPRQRIEAECARRGRDALIAGCADLLLGHAGNVDDTLIMSLGGAAARQVLDGGEGGREGYWPRVWAARGLLHALQDGAGTQAAVAAIIHAAGDEAWRVREMAAKVVAAHRIGDALDAMAALRGDPVPRVRSAAQRAVTALTSARA